MIVRFDSQYAVFQVDLVIVTPVVCNKLCCRGLMLLSLGFPKLFLFCAVSTVWNLVIQHVPCNHMCMQMEVLMLVKVSVCVCV